MQPRLCARCGWMLPHGPEVCRHPKGPLPHSHKAHGRLQDLAFDDHLHGIRVNGRFRHLGWLKWAILNMLRQHPGQILPKERIEAIWDAQPEPPSRSLIAVHVYQMRHLLQGSGWRIRNIRGEGYVLEREGAS